jgi:sarcosine oxidase subunit beta
MSQVKVLVVGGGIAGTNITYSLAKRGVEVTLLEAAPFVGGASSGVNAGTLSPQNTPPALAALGVHSMEVWGRREKEIAGGVGFHLTGGLRVAETREEDEAVRALVQERAAMGLPIEYLRGQALRELAPYLGQGVVSAGFSPLEGYADVLTASENTARAARARGAVVVCSCKIRTLERLSPSGFAATSEDGRVFRSEALVLSAGLWSKPLGALLGLDLPLRVRINQMAVTEPHAPLLPHIVLHANRNLSVKQKPSGNILIGGGWPGYGTWERGRAQASYESLLGNAALAGRVIPGLLDATVIRMWAGFDGRTGDQLPILGPIPGVKGLYVVTCCSGGFLLGPLSGEIIAELITRGRSPVSIDRFAYAA